MAGHRRKSKKPSGTKAESLLEASTFFVDRCLGKSVGVALRRSRAEGRISRGPFRGRCRRRGMDIRSGASGWIVITKDKAIRRGPSNFRRSSTANVRMFSLSSGNMTGDEMASAFVDNRLKMGRFIKDHLHHSSRRASRRAASHWFIPGPARDAVSSRDGPNGTCGGPSGRPVGSGRRRAIQSDRGSVGRLNPPGP